MSALFDDVGNDCFADFIKHFFSAFPIISRNLNAVFWCRDNGEFNFGIFCFSRGFGAAKRFFNAADTVGGHAADFDDAADLD